jgi:hypothetical protein
MLDIFTENLLQTFRDPCHPAVRKCFLSNRKIRTLLGSYFVQILQNLFAVFYNLKNVVQVSNIIARIFHKKLISSKAKTLQSGLAAYLHVSVSCV